MSDMERAADAGGEVVKTVVEHSRLGRNQFLVAVLAPTLALVSVTAGIVANGRSEEKARKREAEIQRSELVLPVYKDVVRRTEQLDAALDTCDDIFIESTLEGEALIQQLSEQCRKPLDEAFDDLDEAVNVALLVSDDELRTVAGDFRDSQEDFEEIAKAYNDITLEEYPEEFDDLDQAYQLAKEDLESVTDALIDAARTQVLKPTG